ncbi:MAG: bifunctional phosphoribosylaminoimidazolecarboxamide formyltransferase/IMP cyclohydrolase, partial [Parvularculaceae bacterium]
ELKRRLAAKAFARTGAYDAAISQWFARQVGEEFQKTITFGGTLRQALRYGENPHQLAAFYASADRRAGVATARQAQGKELSCNNLNDTDAAYECVAEFGADRPTVAIIKHANPCGVATGASLLDAYEKALRCDPVSAFGGVIAVNRRLDRAAAETIVKIFTEVIIAPDADEDALSVFAAKKNLRVLLAGALPDPGAVGIVMKSIAGGFLVQTRDNGRTEAKDLKIVTKRQPTDAELQDMLFAFRVAKHVKSNAIVYAKNEATVGIGAGQMSRVDSSRIAARKSADAAEAAGQSEPLAKGSVVASDAFFPFPDGLLAAAEAGATAVIQHGGSIRDADVIKAADDVGLAMAFTGMRHFRH